MHLVGIRSLYEIGLVAVTYKQTFEFVVADAGEHGRIGNLVTVQVKNGQYGAVGFGIQELVRMPGCRKRTRLSLTIAHNTSHQQVRVVERRAVCVRQGIAEFAAFVDGTGRFRRHVTWDTAGERELSEQPFQARFVLGDVRVQLAVGAFQISIGHQTRSSVTGAGDIDHV